MELAMNLSHLQTYIKVASTQSFTRAAQDLFITQPTVTHHIQSLEQELGYQLFVRSSSEIRLTVEGKQLLQKAHEIFRIIDDIKGTAMSQESGMCGTLNIAASSVMGTYFLTPIFKTLLETYPHVDIRLHFGNAYTTATWVQNSFVDLGFAPRSPGFSRLKFTTLLVEPCVLAISSPRYATYSHELEHGDCANQPFIIREKGTKVHDVAMRWLKKQSWYSGMRTPTILPDMESIKNLVLADAGITILPRCCVRRYLDQGLMKEVKTDIKPNDVNYFMIQRKNENENELIRMFLQLLKTTAQTATTPAKM